MAISAADYNRGIDKINNTYKGIENQIEIQLSSLHYQIADCGQAISAMPDTKNLRKYIGQLDKLETELRKTENFQYTIGCEKSKKVADLMR